MGRPIVYCDTCGNRILEADLTHGKAVQLGVRYYCETCKPADILPSKPAAAPPPTSPDINSIVRVGGPQRPSTTTLFRMARRRQPGVSAIVVGLACVAAAGGLIAMAVGGGRPVEVRPVVRGPDVKPDKDPPAVVDLKAVADDVERFAAAHPGDLKAILAKCDEALPALGKSDPADRIRRLRQDTEARLRADEGDVATAALIAQAKEAWGRDGAFLRKKEIRDILDRARAAAAGLPQSVDRAVAAAKEYEQAFKAAADAAWKKAADEAEAALKSGMSAAQALARIESFPPQFREGEWDMRFEIERRRYGAPPPPPPPPVVAPLPPRPPVVPPVVTPKPTGGLWEDYERATRLIVEEDKHREGATILMDVIQRCNDLAVLMGEEVSDEQMLTIATTGHYNVASYFSRLGRDPARACEFLEVALRNGFDDWSRIDGDRDFDPIRMDERFRALARKWRGKSLGAQGQPLGEEQAKKLGLSEGQGGLVIGRLTPKGPAESGGMKIGDIVVELDRKALPLEDTLSAVRQTVVGLKAGAEVQAVVIRGGRKVPLRMKWPKE